MATTDTKRRSMTLYRVSESKEAPGQIYLDQNEVGKDNQGVQVVQVGGKEEQASITTDNELKELATDLKSSFSTEGKSVSVYHITGSRKDMEQAAPGEGSDGVKDVYLIQTCNKKNPYENFDNEVLDLVNNPDLDLTSEENPIIVYRMSDTQSDMKQTDPSQPDYVKNKELVQDVRPILINGNAFLGAKPETGPVNFVAGKNVSLDAEGNTIVITATGGGGSGGGGFDIVEGVGIDVKLNNQGKKVVSLEPNSITDDYVKNVSVSKLIADDTTILILNGGKANVGT